MRQRPTAALLELRDPYTGWTSHDYRLQEAMGTLERDTCPNCSNPSWLCHSAHNGIDFEIRYATCFGKAAMDEGDNTPGARPLEDGEYKYAVATGIKNEDGTYEPLPSRAEALAKLAD